jgi:hypothetical protein
MFTGLSHSFDRRLAQIASTALLLALVCVIAPNVARAIPPSANPGDPLFCQPQEGTTFLIVNGGSGIFTVDGDCFNNNYANDTQNSITTTQGGTLTKSGGTGNYVYTPPTPNFTGLDTFQMSVTTVWNSAGGTGSAGGTVAPVSGIGGGPATLTITLNVIPATTSFTVAANIAVPIPVPAGSVSGCSAAGNPGKGPVAGAVYGCTTAIAPASSPAHGTLTASGNGILYTPTAGYVGTDTFTYEAFGVNNDGSTSLDSGPVTVIFNLLPAGTPLPPTWSLLLLGLLSLGIFISIRRLRHAPQR